MNAPQIPRIVFPHCFPSASFKALRRWAAYTCLAATACCSSITGQAWAQSSPLDFANHVQPVLQANCVACHNQHKSEGGLNLESFEWMMKGGDSGPSLTVGKAMESEILKRVTAEDDSLMPPADNTVGAKHLDAAQIEMLQAWINTGALAGTANAMTRLQWKAIPDSVRPMYAMDTSTDGQTVVASRGNQVTVYRWPSITGAADTFSLVDPAVQAQLQSTAPATHLDLIQSIAVSPDAMRIATGGFRDVKIWRREVGPGSEGLASMLRGSRAIVGSPDGLTVAHATQTQSIAILRTDTGRLSHRLECPAPVDGLAWTSNGQRILAATNDAKVLQFELVSNPTDTVLQVFPSTTIAIEQPLTCLLILDDTSLIGMTPDRKLQWWTIAAATETSPWSIQKTERLADASNVVAFCRFEEAGQSRLAVATADGSVRIVAGNEGTTLRTLAHGAPVVDVAASGDHSKLTSLGADGVIKTWNATDGSLMWEQHLDYDTQRAIDRTESLAARQKSSLDRSLARVPELEKAKQGEVEAQGKLETAKTQMMEELSKKQAELETQDKNVAEGEAAVAAAKLAVEEAMKKVEQVQKDLEARQQQKLAAQKAKQEVETKIGTLEKNLAGAVQAIERAATGIANLQSKVEQEQQRFQELEKVATETKAQARSTPAVLTRFTRDHRSLITAHSDGTLHVYQADRGTPQAVFGGGFTNYVGMLTTQDGRVLAVTADGRAMGWSLGNRWALERTLGNASESLFSDRVTALDWSDDGAMLAVGSGEPSRFGDLKLIRVADGVMVKDWGPVHSDSILVVRFSPDGTMIATGAADKLIRVNRLEGDASPRTLEGHTHHVLGLAWHDDGHWIASGSADNTVKIWDVESGTAARTIPGFGKEVTAVAFVGRTNQLISSSADHQSRLHDAGNGSLIRALAGPSDALYCAVAAGKSPVAFAGGQDGVLWVWQLDNGQVLQQIK